MANSKTSVHLVNDNGAIECQYKSGKHKLSRDAWNKLLRADRCGACQRIIERREKPRRSNVDTCVHRASTRSDKACYTPRYGQVRS
jgi:hypothetical protein